MKKLVMKNYFLWPVKEFAIESIADWLSNLMLHGQESRVRTRFIKIIAERAKELQEVRKTMLDDYGEKNKEGKLIYLDEKGKDTTDNTKARTIKIKKDKKMEDFQKEFTAYLEEEYIIDVRPETKDTIYGVRDLILNTKEEFSGPMAGRYNEWCDAFENIKKS